ncbi:MAG TPA: hypothetical protein VM425_11330 [Myxococcota bacterium]|nr:hypothetical protein [Myxococcota bacterium]
MLFDLAKDTRRLRVGLFAGALSLLLVLAWIGLREARTEWRSTQADFFDLTGDARHTTEILQNKNCSGQTERCATCHLGARRRDLGAQTPKVYRAHPPSMLRHLERRTGCSTCHGGCGRALESELAHALPGGRKRDPLLGQPYIQASCARCHLPGAQEGMQRLVAGAEIYVRLGCLICHPLNVGGRGSWDFGTDLRAPGRKSLAYLRMSLIDPAANFPGSTMPSFKNYFSDNPEGLTDVLVFLLSLNIEDAGDCSRGNKTGAGVDKPCSGCHAGAGGRAGGRMAHKCVYIVERKDELGCAACHQHEIPAPGPGGGRCPVINRHRPNCVVCHETGEGDRPG